MWKVSTGNGGTMTTGRFSIVSAIERNRMRNADIVYIFVIIYLFLFFDEKYNVLVTKGG